jgi:hypothetical protein
MRSARDVLRWRRGLFRAGRDCLKGVSVMSTQPSVSGEGPQHVLSLFKGRNVPNDPSKVTYGNQPVYTGESPQTPNPEVSWTRPEHSYLPYRPVFDGINSRKSGAAMQLELNKDK